MVHNSRQLCKDFVVQSRKTWNRIKHSQDLGLSISEETITDNNLYDLQKKHQHKIMTFKFNKRQEPYMGADWEFREDYLKRIEEQSIPLNTILVYVEKSHSKNFTHRIGNF